MLSENDLRSVHRYRRGRKQSMSSIIKKGWWPLARLISSSYVCIHVVPKSHKMGDWVTWSHVMAISSPGRSVGAGSPACKEEERCWCQQVKREALAHHCWLSPNTTLKKNQPQGLLLYLLFEILCRLWFQVWLLTVGGKNTCLMNTGKHLEIYRQMAARCWRRRSWVHSADKPLGCF